MSSLSFKLDQLFVLLVPDLVVDVVVAITFHFPDESDFVKKFLSVRSHFIILMISPLRANPHP
jgi:hypothetical protein